MAVNRGKQFENIVKESFEKVEGVSVDRLHDQTTGYMGSSNICDFIVYRKPYEYYFECKSVHGNTLSIHSIPKADKHGVLHGHYGNITDTQWEGLLEKSKINGVTAGIICWWVDRDVTMFLSIHLLKYLYSQGFKSVPYNLIEKAPTIDLCLNQSAIEINGKKKRVFFDYDMKEFLGRLDNGSGKSV